MSSALFVVVARALLIVTSLAVGTLLLGPFQGVEALLYLTDKQAHVLAFFVLTNLALAAAPRVRRDDLAIVVLALAGASEIAQACVGRDATIGDMLADSAGVMLAWAPTYVSAMRSRARRERVHGERRVGRLPVPAAAPMQAER